MIGIWVFFKEFNIREIVCQFGPLKITKQIDNFLNKKMLSQKLQ